MGLSACEFPTSIASPGEIISSMRRTLLCLLLVAVLAPAANASPRDVVVLLPDDGIAAARPDGALALHDVGLAEAIARTGATRVRMAGGALRGVVLVLGSDDPAFDPWAVAAALRASGRVRAAAPDLHLRLFVTPNDTYYAPDQWWAQTAP